MSDFHDPDLRQQLGRLSGPYPDDNEAFASWQRRVGYARRRRVVAWTTGAALSLIVATVGAAAVQGPGRHTVVPSAEISQVSDVGEGTEADDSTTTEATVPKTIAAAVVAPETTPSSEVVETSMPEPLPEAPAVGGDQPASASPSKSQGGSSGNPAPTGAASATKAFNSAGGSITVRQSGTQLTLVSTNPAAGFQTDDTSHSGDRVQVIFQSESHQSQITVKVVNGVMKASTTEHVEGGHDTTVPESSSTGDGGDGKGKGG
jgi:hypothetical protein